MRNLASKLFMLAILGALMVCNRSDFNFIGLVFFIGIFSIPSIMLMMIAESMDQRKRKQENELMREHRLSKAKAWKAKQ